MGDESAAPAAPAAPATPDVPSYTTPTGDMAMPTFDDTPAVDTPDSPADNPGADSANPQAGDAAPADTTDAGDPAGEPTEAEFEGWLATLDPKAAKAIADLRKEAGNYRTQAKEYKDAFDGYDDGDRQTFLDLARTLRTDPAAAAEWMRQTADQLLAGDTPTPDAPAEPGADDTPLTKAELEQWYADRQAADQAARDAQAAKAEQDRQVQAITDEAKGLGYEPETADYAALMYTALHKTDGDIAKAHEALKAERQALVDAEIARLKEAARTSPQPVPQAGAHAPGEQPITDFDAAREGMFAKLAAKFGG